MKTVPAGTTVPVPECLMGLEMFVFKHFIFFLQLDDGRSILF